MFLNSIAKIKFKSDLRQVGALVGSNGKSVRTNSRDFHSTGSLFIYDRLVRGASLSRFGNRKFARVYQTDYHLIKDVFTESGAIAALPKWYRFGLAKVCATIVLFVLVGSYISKAGVRFLEENDIFKPEEDDDDDDD